MPRNNQQLDDFQINLALLLGLDPARTSSISVEFTPGDSPVVTWTGTTRIPLATLNQLLTEAGLHTTQP